MSQKTGHTAPLHRSLEEVHNFLGDLRLEAAHGLRLKPADGERASDRSCLGPLLSKAPMEQFDPETSKCFSPPLQPLR